MRLIVIDFDLFEPLCGGIEWSERIVYQLIQLMVEADRQYIRCHGAPKLYEAGVRYKREPPGREDFKAVPAILRDGHADCEDLAAWRVAELLESGENARVVIKKWEIPTGRDRPFYQYHILCRRADGRLEDPSAILGMKGKA